MRRKSKSKEFIRGDVGGKGAISGDRTEGGGGGGQAE